MRKCYISKNYRHIENAGDKAKTDIETTLSELGFKNLGLPHSTSKNAVTAYLRTLASTLMGVARLRRGDMLVLQYPLKKYYDFVVRRAVARGVKVVTVIHDLGSFRRRKLTVEEEIARLNRSSAVIVHTPQMEKWLKDNGLTAPTVVLGLFDYLSPAPLAGTHHTGQEADGQGVMFAGNCSEETNGWIYRLVESDPGIRATLYGGGTSPTLAQNPRVSAKGYVDCDTLIATAQGRYGVVWYGSSLTEGAGPLGEYLRYNAPHKTSLYLRAGLPVVIWGDAALAQIVTDLGVGIAVPTLQNLSSVLSEVPEADYVRMRENARALAAKLNSGHFTAAALSHAQQIMI